MLARTLPTVQLVAAAAAMVVDCSKYVIALTR